VSKALTKIFEGRFTAQLDKPVVMFVIGMRINRLSDLDRWSFVAAGAKSRMAG
jgi:hypothetical protein